MLKGLTGACRGCVERHAFVRFAITGVAATVIHYGVYYLFIWAGIPMELSYAAGWIVSLAFNFWLSGRFTFRTRLTAGKGAKFLACHLINFALHMGLLEFWVRVVHIPALIAPFLVFAIAVPINYFMVRYAMKDKTDRT